MEHEGDRKLDNGTIFRFKLYTRMDILISFSSITTLNVSIIKVCSVGKSVVFYKIFNACAHFAHYLCLNALLPQRG